MANDGQSPSLGLLAATDSTWGSSMMSAVRLASTRLAPTSMKMRAPRSYMFWMVSIQRTGEAICCASRSRLAARSAGSAL